LKNTRIEFIRPLPAEGEQEDGHHHRDGQRQDDLDKGAEGAGAVYICTLLKLIGYALKELQHHKDIERILKAATNCREDYQRPIGIGQLKGAACQELNGSLIVPRHNRENIEGGEML
jgi:hypothetical protein